MRRIYLFLIVTFPAFSLHAQQMLQRSQKATHWVDSVYNSLTPDQRIAQLMVIRESAMDSAGQPVIYDDSIKAYIKQFNIGGICLFQGTSAIQATHINEFQQMAQTPLITCIDGEMGLGMRMGDVQKFPDQMTLGAMRNADILIYKIGHAIGEQCKRAGINVDYAPVIDINNNPKNPVIGYRSFGQNKYVVADYGIAIMKGMQSYGIMACAKHFPGHGDVDVDSHLDLPVIHKSLESLDTLELYPFKKIFKAGIASVMIAHLSIPAIDSTPHVASSISPKFVTGLLRNKIGFTGISFTDALDMKGVAKYFPPGEVAVKSLEAGNDMLCLPTEIGLSIQRIQAAIIVGKLNADDIKNRVKKVLYAKYNLGLNHVKTIDTTGISAELNTNVPKIRIEVAKRSLTAVSLQKGIFSPLHKREKIAYVAFGTEEENSISKLMKGNLNADVFCISYHISSDSANQLIARLKNGSYKKIVVGIHHYNKTPANNFGMSNESVSLMNSIARQFPSADILVFGNPYAISKLTDYKNIIACYEDDDIFQKNAFDFLIGKAPALGRLPVSVTASLPFGTGILVNKN
ncbi:MAG: glycoside hydrolase family 3 N-terminal domain-containing protein [Arachidicoccus sp.]|nr:glycoside hydrolase family 3 N-terminal domain-containing protein [Arachidicoccus sp.]